MSLLSAVEANLDQARSARAEAKSRMDNVLARATRGKRDMTPGRVPFVQ